MRAPPLLGLAAVAVALAPTVPVAAASPGLSRDLNPRLSTSPSLVPSPSPGPAWHVLARLADDRITEASGLTVSERHPGVVFVVNDSGDAPRVFAVGPNGRTRAVLTLDGAEAVDWEALATGPDATLWVGDIGDNARVRDEVTVYRVREPDVLHDGPVRWTSYRLRYPDRPQDAEALMVHPRTGRLFVATKSLAGAGLYAAPRRLSADGVTTVRRVGAVGLLVTGGEFSPDGSRLVLRDYAAAYVYAASDRGPLGDRRTVRLPDQVQGESVTWTRDGRALLVGSEGTDSVVWRVPLPSEVQATPSLTAIPTATATASQPTTTPSARGFAGARDEDERPGLWRASPLMSALVVAVLAAGVVALRARRRHRR